MINIAGDKVQLGKKMILRGEKIVSNDSEMRTEGMLSRRQSSFLTDHRQNFEVLGK